MIGIHEVFDAIARHSHTPLTIAEMIKFGYISGENDELSVIAESLCDIGAVRKGKRICCVSHKEEFWYKANDYKISLPHGLVDDSYTNIDYLNKRLCMSIH